MRNEKINLAILFLISLLLSTYLFFKTYVIASDGAFQYIPMAKVFATGSLRDAIGFGGQQPLYSFFIALASRGIADFEVAGRLVASFFGILVIFPVYFLGKRIFDQKIAFLSAFFLAIHPYVRRFSADVLKESAYLFFLAMAVWFTLKTVEREKAYSYLFIPFFSALAYLIRPDGIEVLFVAFFYLFFIKKFGVSKKRWAIISCMVLSSAFLLFPYLFHLKGMTGEWTLSKAKSIGQILGWGFTGDGVPFATKVLFSLKKVNLEIFTIYHPLLIFLLAIGLLRNKFSDFRSEEKFLISLFVLHYVVLFLLILNLTNWTSGERSQEYLLSGRHVLPLFLFSIYWVGEGFLVLHHWIYRKVESSSLLRGLKPERKFAAVLVTFLILTSAIILPKTLKPQRYERLTEKWAGIWIKNQSGEGTTIFTTVPRVAYYANGNYEYINFEKDTPEKVEASMTEKKASYLVIQEKEAIDSPKQAEFIKKNFIEAIRFEKGGMEKIIVYKRIK